MKIAMYMPVGNKTHREVLTAFHQGFDLDPTVHINIFDVGNVFDLDSIGGQAKEFDAAVVFGMGKEVVDDSKYRGRVMEEYHDKLEKDVIVLERGYIMRNEYWAVGLNGLNGRADFNVPTGGYFAPVRFATLIEKGLDTSPLYDPEGHIVVAMQVPWDASVQYVNYEKWYADTVGLLTDQQELFVVKPHPLAYGYVPLVLGEDSFLEPDTYSPSTTIEQALTGARLVITANSNSCVDAALRGIPTRVLDAGAMMYNSSFKDMTKIPAKGEDCDTLKVALDLERVTYAQWTLDEMRSGEAWQHIRGALKC